MYGSRFPLLTGYAVMYLPSLTFLSGITNPNWSLNVATCCVGQWFHLVIDGSRHHTQARFARNLVQDERVLPCRPDALRFVSRAARRPSAQNHHPRRSHFTCVVDNWCLHSDTPTLSFSHREAIVTAATGGVVPAW